MLFYADILSYNKGRHKKGVEKLPNLNRTATKTANIRETLYIITIIALVITIIAMKHAPPANPESIVYNMIGGDGAVPAISANLNDESGDFADDNAGGIPNEDESLSGSSGKSSPNTKVANSEKININTAGVSQLMRLPGIGEVTAQKIIDYRNTNGAFEKIEDIKKVNGIGNAKFDGIKANIVVE